MIFKLRFEHRSLLKFVNSLAGRRARRIHSTAASLLTVTAASFFFFTSSREFNL